MRISIKIPALLKQLLAACICCIMVQVAFAQKDSTNRKLDSFLLSRKGIFGKLGKSIVANNKDGLATPVRTDLAYVKYEGDVIRNIVVINLPFGLSLSDTGGVYKNVFIKWADDLHKDTRASVIKNNLFFKEGQKVIPALIADNERHLRDLSFLQDARISVNRVKNTVDSVDVWVYTKDVLSIGGSLRMHGTERYSVSVSEDNFAGTGNEILFKTYFDSKRKPVAGLGGEAIIRNIGGSFIDWSTGITTFEKNINTFQQNEQVAYTRIVRPLVNAYKRFTYAAEISQHKTNNAYAQDSLYKADQQYAYDFYDAWLGWNTGAFKVFGGNRNNRYRTLVGGRYIRKQFTVRPEKFAGQYFYQYADINAMLFSVSIFGQDFYKTQYVYGFGRNEDIPEGLDISVTGGWVKTDGIDRTYTGIDLSRFFLTRRDGYLKLTARAGGYLKNNKYEDVNLLFGNEYFSRLINLGSKWKYRTFTTAGITHQNNRRLGEPLFLQNNYGLREFRGDTANFGRTRIIAKAEFVFFTPLNFLNFKLATFAFANVGLLTPDKTKLFDGEWYKTIGAGFRIRNESLIFETIEARAFYFPEGNLRGKPWYFSVNTGIRFKYNQQLLKKPDFIIVN